MPTPTEFWFWMLTNRETGKRRKSVCRFREADAWKLDPTAERVPGTCEIRDLPNSQDEWVNFTAKCGNPTAPFSHQRRGGISA